MTVIDFNWITDISDRNLLGLIDVLADMRDELETGIADPQIRILPAAIRFPQLYPAHSIPNNDSYCRLRMGVANLLLQRGVICSAQVVGTEHRWKQRIAFEGDVSSIVGALEQARLERLKRPSLSTHRPTLFGRRNWITLVVGALVATGVWLVLDYIFPNQSRHVVEGSFFGLVAAAVVLVAWPIVQSTIGTAIWEWLRPRPR